MKKVLVVEDSGFQRKRIVQELENNGFQVLEAENGEQALTLIREERPVLISTDLAMPEFDGFWLLERLLETSNEIPVIIFTSDVSESTANKVKQLGAKELIKKPIKDNGYIDAVKRHIH